MCENGVNNVMNISSNYFCFSCRTPGEANPLLEGRDCLSVMKGIVTQVGEHQHEG